MDTIFRISDAANLGIHAMIYVARTGPGVNHSVSKIAQAQGGSKAHLSKVMQRLAKVGLLASSRGRGGGFFLGREAKQIRLIEILEAIDGPLSGSKCLMGRKKCMLGGCALGLFITGMNRQMRGFLASRSLADMVEPSVSSPSRKSVLSRCDDRGVSPLRSVAMRGAAKVRRKGDAAQFIESLWR